VRDWRLPLERLEPEDEFVDTDERRVGDNRGGLAACAYVRGLEGLFKLDDRIRGNGIEQSREMWPCLPHL